MQEWLQLSRKENEKKMNNWVILQVEFPDHVERKKTSAPTPCRMRTPEVGKLIENSIKTNQILGEGVQADSTKHCIFIFHKSAQRMNK